MAFQSGFGGGGWGGASADTPQTGGAGGFSNLSPQGAATQGFGAMGPGGGPNPLQVQADLSGLQQKLRQAESDCQRGFGAACNQAQMLRQELQRQSGMAQMNAMPSLGAGPMGQGMGGRGRGYGPDPTYAAQMIGAQFGMPMGGRSMGGGY
jgi:hypothetical protein